MSQKQQFKLMSHKHQLKFQQSLLKNHLDQQNIDQIDSMVNNHFLLSISWAHEYYSVM